MPASIVACSALVILPRLLVVLLHEAIAGVVVGQARGVAQQVLHRHLALRGHKLELAVVLDADLGLGKLRNELGDGVSEQEVTVLQQHHDANRDDRLGHGEDAEDGVHGLSQRCCCVSLKRSLA
jgi:hypothetical protein